MQLVPRALEEQEGVIVRSRAGVQVQIVARARSHVNQVLAPGLAHSDAVEGHIVIHRSRVADEAVVRNDLDARFIGRISGSGSGSAVMGANDEDFDPLSNQGFDVFLFLRGRTLAEQNLDFVTRGLQRIAEARLILNPARLVFSGEHNTDGQLGFSGFFATCTKQHRSDHYKGNQSQTILLLKHTDPPSEFK